ncbi:MAG: hypothetical protein KBG28_20360 [Kofleriaceae bacterium]|jgi:hypothetical protein|nr:hypothetical protein [Kofleriaceae bacterium]MBP6838176.1 hypothetical protein [Kofleriaceae bacterium]MBP9206337.1 hypothetical protein [Kofleriaceae bacterium]
MRTLAPCVLATSVWLGAPGCTAEAPTDPSWQEDVLPILVAHCSRCHAQPAHIAPDLLQWVSYDDVTGPGDATFYGAASNAMALVDSIRTGYMPKDGRFPPDEVAVQTLANWAAAGAARGPTRVGNHTPTLTVRELSRDGATVVLEVETADEDGDFVVGQLLARPAAGGADTVVALLPSGRAQLTLDLSALPPGRYVLQARLDDGGGFGNIDAGELMVGGAR